MALYKGLVVSNGERQVLNILEQYNGIIKVVPKVRFFDVVEWNSKMDTMSIRTFKKHTMTSWFVRTESVRDRGFWARLFNCLN